MPVRHPLAEICAPDQELAGDRWKEKRKYGLVYATVGTNALG